MQWLFLVILDKNPSKKTYFHITVTTNHFCFLSYKRRRIFAENYSMYGFFCFPKNEQNIDKIGSFVNKDLILRHKISIEHILFIQTSINQKNVITIQTISDRKYTYRCSLKNIVKQFDCFVYISKSTIININMIVKVNSIYSVIYLGSNNCKLRVSRTFTKPLITRLKQNYLV
jgi:hypothetical protein